MKTILIFIFSFLAAASFAQPRLTGTTGGWTTVDANTYTATFTRQTDLTNNSYTCNDIEVGFRVISGTAANGIETALKMYTVTAIANSTSSTIDLTVDEVGATQGAPSGLVFIYDPDGRMTIPQVPVGSTGATAALQAAIDTYNSRYTYSVTFTNGAPVGAPATNTPEIVQDTSGSNILYRWDGDSWEIIGLEIALGSGAPVGSPATGQRFYIDYTNNFIYWNDNGSWAVMQAVNVPVGDLGGYFAGTEMEAVTQALGLDVSNLQTLSGRPDGSTHNGTFTGSTIPDNETTKQNLQSLETAVETKLSAEVDGSTTNELVEFTASSSAPGSPKQGDLWHDTDGDSVFVRDGGAWVFMAIRVGGGSTDVAVAPTGDKRGLISITSDSIGLDVNGTPSPANMAVGDKVIGYDDSSGGNVSFTGQHIVDLMQDSVLKARNGISIDAALKIVFGGTYITSHPSAFTSNRKLPIGAFTLTVGGTDSTSFVVGGNGLSSFGVAPLTGTRLTIRGTGNGSATNALLIESLDGTDLASVKDNSAFLLATNNGNGYLQIGTSASFDQRIFFGAPTGGNPLLYANSTGFYFGTAAGSNTVWFDSSNKRNFVISGSNTGAVNTTQWNGGFRVFSSTASQPQTSDYTHFEAKTAILIEGATSSSINSQFRASAPFSLSTLSGIHTGKNAAFLHDETYPAIGNDTTQFRKKFYGFEDVPAVGLPALFAYTSFRAKPTFTNGLTNYIAFESRNTVGKQVWAMGTGVSAFYGNVGIKDSVPETELDVTGTIKMNKLVGQDSTPTVSIHANAGTGATISLALADGTTGSTQSSNVAGRIQFATGSGTLTAGEWLTVTFAGAYSVPPVVILGADGSGTPGENASNIIDDVRTVVTTTNFKVYVDSDALALTSTTFQFAYHVIGGK